MEDLSPDDMDSAFGGGPMPPPADAAPAEDHSAETEEALDAAIDEAFEAEDPVLRREAFKRAMRLCNESAAY